MPTPNTISDVLLVPISPEKPSGNDLRSTGEWISIKDARPDAYDTGDKGIWTPVQTKNASWTLLKDLATEALERKTKDLNVAILLTEANIKLHRFAGMRDSLRLIRELLTRFWDTGLYPPIEDEDLETRSGPLQWLNERMADALREIPLTARTDPGDNYSYVYFQESRSATGRISAAQFDAAVDSTPRAYFENMYEDFEEACRELKELDRIAEEKFPPDGLALSESKTALEEVRVVLDSILRKKRTQEPDPVPGGTAASEPVNPAAQQLRHKFVFTHSSSGDGNLGASWEQAEQLARAGQVKEAISEMTRLAAAEPNGRARFHRKLLLAGICLSSKRERLAKTILEELAEQIDRHQLENWETAEVIGAVWGPLYRCYKNEQAGIADPEKAAALFLRLCRLDPWQALACSEDK